MKVKLLKDKSVVEVNDSYGLRLITQGMAVALADNKKPAKKPAKAADDQ